MDSEMAKIAKAYQSSTSGNSNLMKAVIAMAVFGFILVLSRQYMPAETPRLTLTPSSSSLSHRKILRLATWNIAAINNNPFEYWITMPEDPLYNDLMKKVSDFIEDPDDNDIQVKKVFTETMFQDLKKSMTDAGWAGVNETTKFWNSDYKNRKIISGFIKDGELGKKRLASMPDRVTNSINTVDKGVVCRPTVINCYSGDLSTMDLWWKAWRDFMFKKKVTVSKEGEDVSVAIKDMLTPIKKSKYPSITEEEEKISIPLQTLCAAIFDAILVHMMNELAEDGWMPLREEMCNKLNRKKTDRTIEILEKTYVDADIQFLQEVAGSFGTACANHKIGTEYFDVYSPAEMDSDRDQNSFILLKKEKFINVVELTSEALAELAALPSKKPAPVAIGDLLVLSATDGMDGTKYLLASFHGDTNGLATIPVVTAVYNYAINKRPDHKLLFGMDANTYTKPESDQQGVTEFAKFYTNKKLNSCYGPTPNPYNFTTFHARTHLQTQLNKAVSLEEKDIKGDKNPKDFIVFFNSDFTVLSTIKDNTGSRKFTEGMVFPTLKFPSDHGVTSTILLEEPVVSARTINLDEMIEDVETSSRKMDSKNLRQKSA